MSLAKRILDNPSARAHYARARAAELKASGASSAEIKRAVGSELGRRRSFFGGSKADEIRIVFTGSDVLDKKFAEMPQKLQRKALARATREVAKFTLSIAREYAPHRTGALEGSLQVRAFSGKRRAKYKNTVGATVQNKGGLFKGDEFYGGFLEFGTAERFHRKTGKSTGFIPQMKHWFLRPALYAFPERKLSLFIHWVRNWMLTEAVRAK